MPSKPLPTPGREPLAALALRGVSKNYKTRLGVVQALGDTDLMVGRSEFVALVGPSGCGKSTLLSIAAGLLPTSTGAVEVGGEQVKKPSSTQGIVFQRDLLLEWRNAKDNVLLPVELRRLRCTDYETRAAELLAMAGLAHASDRFPRELSGGMRQRVALCRALVTRPQLLLLDEPFAAVDAMAREALNVDVARICRELEISVLMITHSVDEAVFMADRVLVMRGSPGAIVADLAVDLPAGRVPEIRRLPRFVETVSNVRELLWAT